MRQILIPCLAGLFLLATMGCNSSSGPPKTPASMMEPPKQGPVAAGSSGGPAPKGTGVVPEKKNSAD